MHEHRIKCLSYILCVIFFLCSFLLYVFIIPHHLLHSTIGCVLLRWMDFVFAFRCFTGGYDYFCFKLPYTLLTNTMYNMKDTENERRIPIDHVLFSFKTMNRINMFFILSNVVVCFFLFSSLLGIPYLVLLRYRAVVARSGVCRGWQVGIERKRHILLYAFYKEIIRMKELCKLFELHSIKSEAPQSTLFNITTVNKQGK